MGFFDTLKYDRLKEGLTKTRDNIFGRVQRLVTAKSKIDNEMIEKLEEILITADVGVNTSMKIIERIKTRVREEKYEDANELDRLLHDEIRNALGAGNQMNRNDYFSIPAEIKPFVIMIVGVNGVGKTTTIGKLAYNYRTAKKNVIIAAADTFRAAANEQIEIWAQRASVDVIQQAHGADPAAVAYDSLKAAKARGADVVIIDTAGRLHTKTPLMEELKKIRRVMQKIVPEAPHEVLLVLDASTGQNALEQARQFDNAVGVTGLIITKLDGTAKGGIVFAINQELNIPVKFIGIGEQIGDLQPFDKSVFVNALLQTV
ncbi:MAG: signal recognition particle-docking protein FtsY [Bacteroidota bacterium]